MLTAPLMAHCPQWPGHLVTVCELSMYGWVRLHLWLLRLVFVTFHNTHSIFADLIWAEIFEPDLSNSIPTLSHIFTHFCTLLMIPIFLGNDRGTGNTVCFWPGVRWGTGAVLRFDTRTPTITSRGFYVVFGLTPDGVEARKFKPVPYLSSHPASPAFYFLPTCLGHTLTDAPPHLVR